MHKLEIRVKESSDLKDVKESTCALLNSGGGVLSLVFETSQDNLIHTVGVVEKLFQNTFIPSRLQQCFKIRDQSPDSITFEIPPSNSLFTLDYKLFLPTEAQVVRILPIVGRSEVQRIIERKVFECNGDKVPQTFTVGKNCGLQESQTVQFKQLTTGKAGGKRTFAGRIINNNFTHYVSAFANHRGGRIYYGIEDDGVVKGEELSEQDKDNTRDELVRKINTMKWPTDADPILEISFKPVEDQKGNQLTPSRFVMIVFILPCLGGVFTANPESYRVDDQKKVKKLEFREWLVHFKMGILPWPLRVIPHIIPHVIPHVSDTTPWSSERRRKIYLAFTTGLVRCRNNNDTKKFEAWRRLAEKEKYRRGGANLLVMSERAAVEYKRRNFEKAKKWEKRFSRGVRCLTADKLFYETRLRYLRSRIVRAEGNYEQSYKFAEHCFQVMARIPPEFITVWTYLHVAMLVNIVGIRRNEPNKFLEAQDLLNFARRDACTLDNFPGGFADLYQKLFIYGAMTLLKCSLTGEVLRGCFVSSEEINTAANELSRAYNLVVRGYPMTSYREIQLLFAQCSIYLRRSELSKIRDEKNKYLKQAMKWVKQAECIACECKFKDMIGYAETFKNSITQEI